MTSLQPHQQRAVDLLVELIRFDSVNARLEGATTGEGPIAAYRCETWKLLRSVAGERGV